MKRMRLANLLLAFALMTALGACSNDDAASPDAGPDDGVAEEAGEPEGAEGAAGDSDAVASDEPEASASNKRRERSPFEDGQRRTVSFDEAAGALQFTAFEPAALPDGAQRTVVHALEPIEGIDNPLLPGMRMIYDLDGNGSVIVTQGNAIGDIGEAGEEVEVSGTPARLVEDGESRVLVLERDGVHLEIRTNTLSREALLALAASLTPYDQIVDGEEADADASDSDAGETAGEGEDAAGEGEGSDG